MGSLRPVLPGKTKLSNLIACKFASVEICVSILVFELQFHDDETSLDVELFIYNPVIRLPMYVGIKKEGKKE